MLKFYVGFVSLAPTPGPESHLLVRSTEAEWWEGSETLIALQINNDFSYITSSAQISAIRCCTYHWVFVKFGGMGALLMNSGRFHASPAIPRESKLYFPGHHQDLRESSSNEAMWTMSLQKKGKKDKSSVWLHCISVLTLLCFLRTLLQKSSCCQHVTNSCAPPR